MSTDINELIKEIAVKHGIAVGHNDPILIVHTINNRLMEDGAKAQEKLLATFKEEMEGVSQRWANDSKQKADKTLNVALTAARTAMESLLADSSEKSAAAIRNEVEKGVRRIEAAAQQGQRAANINMIAAALTLVAASVALFSVIH